MPASPKLRLRILLGLSMAIGPGKIDLLAGIAETGSISAAGRRMGMSYKRAWSLVDAMNGYFRAPLVKTVKGGPRGGGAHLTALGDEVLALYRAIEKRAASASSRELKRLWSLVAERPPSRKR